MRARSGGHEFLVEVTRRFRDVMHGEMIETKIVATEPGYDGGLKPGTTITFPEDGAVGTFVTPGEQGACDAERQER